MRDRDGGAGGTSGVRNRTPAGIGRGREGWFPHAMAGHGTQWHARRAPPEAVPVCRRRDPPLPVTGITGSGQGARQPETQPPGHHVDSRAESQWMRGLGVAPDLFVLGAGNEWGSTVTVFLHRLRVECDHVRVGEDLGYFCLTSSHAFPLPRPAQASECSRQ